MRLLDFYALRRLRSYEPTKSGWTNGNVLFIPLNLVYAMLSQHQDVGVVRQLPSSRVTDLFLNCFSGVTCWPIACLSLTPRSSTLFIV
jgi:hypothetical protein